MSNQPDSSRTQIYSKDTIIPDIIDDEIPPEKLVSTPQADAEITRDQLSLGRRFLNWRTIVPLVIVIAALIFFAQKANINPQKTWAAMSHANLVFFLAAFVIYYLSFGIRAWRWRILLENVG